MERKQFTFYLSFGQAAKRIKKKTDRCDLYDAIINYALFGIEPDMENLPESVAIALELCRPNIEASLRKAKGGMANREREDSAEKDERQDEDTDKMPQRCDEDTGNKKKNKKEGENKNKKENKCYSANTSALLSSEEDGFDAFWDAYPIKSGDIRQAYIWYVEVLKTGVTPETLLEAVKWQAEEKGRYMGGAEKWLRNKGWTEKRPGQAESGNKFHVTLEDLERIMDAI